MTPALGLGLGSMEVASACGARNDVLRRPRNDAGAWIGTSLGRRLLRCARNDVLRCARNDAGVWVGGSAGRVLLTNAFITPGSLSRFEQSLNDR